MRVATQVLKIILKTKGRLTARSINKRMRYIKRILVEDTIVLEARIGIKSK